MAGLILGIDIGTTSLKTAVFDQKGSKQADAVVEYSLITPNTTWVEAPCGVYMDSIRKCLEIVRQKNVDTRQVDTVGFSVQGETRTASPCAMPSSGWITGPVSRRKHCGRPSATNCATR